MCIFGDNIPHHLAKWGVPHEISITHELTPKNVLNSHCIILWFIAAPLLSFNKVCGFLSGQHVKQILDVWGWLGKWYFCWSWSLTQNFGLGDNRDVFSSGVFIGSRLLASSFLSAFQVDWLPRATPQGLPCSSRAEASGLYLPSLF